MMESADQGLLKDKAMQIIARLEEAGHQAYLVGGCVRDEWLGRPVKDYDIATSALPERVEELFERTIPTGLQHGTVTVVVDRLPFEVTTFRKEAGYADYRRPASVEYIEVLEEDLRRRDFTMNAMAMDGRGRILDPFGGQVDLDHGVLRCVGSAAERFSEDALRMLRGIRFAAEYGLEVEAESWTALAASAPLLAHIALERVRAELERMMGGSDPSRALRLLGRSRLLGHTKAGLLWARLPEHLDDWPDLGKLTSAEQRIAYVYGRLDAPVKDCAADLKLLTFSGKQIDAITALLAARSWLQEFPPCDSSAVRTVWQRAAIRYGKSTLHALLNLYRLDPAFAGEARSAVPIWIESGETWLEQMPAASLQELAVTGQDILERLQTRGGPWTGKLLQRLLERTALGLLPNDKEALLQAALAEYDEYRETDKL
ncbi:CCA tRNA nucleotidyltransferase [Paenibacillus puerhi]|uniref:CCA tRNA nucleotidyltransferase n=1 Tax=Paenibacillus puerhi TaxID=2692622 RepID=UPI001F25A766|nr:CCA tRNA nucleotidyltransferase [Paenibacillus puerhi]